MSDLGWLCALCNNLHMHTISVTASTQHASLIPHLSGWQSPAFVMLLRIILFPALDLWLGEMRTPYYRCLHSKTLQVQWALKNVPLSCMALTRFPCESCLLAMADKEEWVVFMLQSLVQTNLDLKQIWIKTRNSQVFAYSIHSNSQPGLPVL